jgi:alkylation response protein AidB-like acyl-CoA dehydrogenase
LLLSRSLEGLASKKFLRSIGNRFKNRLVSDGLIEKFVYYGSIVKVAGTDLAVRITSAVPDLLGLESMSHKYGIEKSFRDAKVTQIYEGTNQANRIDIFNHFLNPGDQAIDDRRPHQRIQ